MIADAIRLMLFPALMAFAASSDLLTMTISNRVSLILVGGFLLMALIIGMSPTVILSHVGAAAVVLVLAFLCFARGWIGGGDAKLAAATALWLGFEHLLTYLVYASLFGGLLTLAAAAAAHHAAAEPAGRSGYGRSACTATTPASPMASRSPPPRWPSIPTPSGCAPSPPEHHHAATSIIFSRAIDIQTPACAALRASSRPAQATNR